ncbi:hypothetical protein HAX54_037706, partial [Datura stramonium]|nr:hypothetical protein [Datura stramonium]
MLARWLRVTGGHVSRLPSGGHAGRVNRCRSHRVTGDSRPIFHFKPQNPSFLPLSFYPPRQYPPKSPPHRVTKIRSEIYQLFFALNQLK